MKNTKAALIWIVKLLKKNKQLTINKNIIREKAKYL